MTISLIHPSRSRADKAFMAAIKWLDSSGGHVEYILSFDQDQKVEYNNRFSNLYHVRQSHFKFVCEKNRSAVDAINNGAKVATGDIIVVMSDDFDCPQGWAKMITDKVQGKTDWIAKTPDGIQKWIITLPIMDRVYYNRFGYIYHSDYLHMFCDTELTCVADLTGRKIELNIPFVHNHYSTGKTVKDEVSIRADKTWEQGERTFIQRAVKHFDLKETPGKITSPDYVNYLRSKGIRI